MIALKSKFSVRLFVTLLFSLFFVCSHAAVSLSADITLAWDANSETDVAGYKIHYLIGAQNGPLNGTGLDQGPSPVTVSLDELEASAASPFFRLSGLSPGKTYHFAVTAYNVEGLESDYSNLVRCDVPLPVTYSLTTSTSGPGSISPEGVITVTEGSNKTLGIAPAANHHISDVIVDGTSVGPVDTYTFENISASHDIQAVFEIDTFVVTTSVSKNGAITSNKSFEVAFGESLVCTIEPDTGYRIAEVKVDGRSIGAVTEYTFSNIAENHSVAARFEKIVPHIAMEVGEVTANSNWRHVPFSRTFTDPVVVASALSYRDDEPAVVRIDNVTGTGFEISVQEWDYLDDDHLEETIGYLVMEAGSYTLPDGTNVEAGTFTTDTTGGVYPFQSAEFGGKFNKIPVVVSSVASYNGPDAVAIRLRHITSTRFEFRIQEQQANRDGHLGETVSYIAWEPCRMELDGFMVEVASTNDVMAHVFKTIPFKMNYPAGPFFLAAIQTTDGGDAAALRWTDRTGANIRVKVEEEQSLDEETAHTTEVVGYFALAPVTTDDVN